MDVAIERQVFQRLMRPLTVVIGQVGFDEVSIVVLAEDDKMIEALDLERLNPAFDERIHVRRSDGGSHNLDVLRLEDFVELGGKLAVVVTDQVRGFMSLFLKLHRDIASLLGDPFRSRIRRHAGHDHATRTNVNEEQNEEIDWATERPDFLLEEVAGSQRLGVALDELGPRSFTALRTKIMPGFAQDFFDGRLADRDAQLLEFADDPAEAPTNFVGHAQHERPNVDRRLWPTPFTGARLWRTAFFGFEPAPKSTVTDDADQLADLRSERFAELDQLTLLGGRHIDPPRQLGAQNLVFDFEKLNHLGQFAIGGAGQEEQKSLPDRRHEQLSVSRCRTRVGQVSVPRRQADRKQELPALAKSRVRAPVNQSVLISQLRIFPGELTGGRARRISLFRGVFRSGCERDSYRTQFVLDLPRLVWP